jgi:glycosyltransferase involved in cell wall biosynthesis
MDETKDRRLHVMALGFRGLPNVPGGVEVHASELYPRLLALGARVTAIGRSPYRPSGGLKEWQGVEIRWLASPRTQGVEALIHTFIGVLYAGVRRPDILHVHAIGPWLWLPLAKLLGLRVVVTHHGQDYLREKWNAPARLLLRLGERLGVTCADERVVISHALREMVQAKYGRGSVLIPNGVGNLRRVSSRTLLDKYQLAPQRYIIQVSRLVPEKRQHDLITAFKAARLPGWKLVLVGGAQGSQCYAEKLRKLCEGDASIVMTGFLQPLEVEELLSHAGIFALPSSHEGLPIALLEAMKLGIPVLASDISPNIEVGLAAENYFPLGDIQALTARLLELSAATDEQRELMAERLRSSCGRYDWDVIAKTTLQVLEGVAGRSRAPVSLVHPKPERAG